MSDEEKVKAIYQKYHSYYDGDVQGTCSLIADEIIKAIGGIAVAGYLKYKSSQRSHWWVEKDGIVFDPMTDDKFYPNEYRREEAHRDPEIFKKVLLIYEEFRVS